ncbi:transporter substrate-binding domain-containing protein [Microvirga sp. W0021]|uniref:Transporter substrate-binding domain-containing protein n=1 Tax=Hohaiivirga grylli TaxID=3133970 RepID=A0ABV0BK39_9HYPH
MSFKKVLGLALIGATALLTQATAQEKSIKIALEGAFPPWNTTLPSGEMAGFEVELSRNLCERMKIKCILVQQDWDGLLPGLSLGKFDAVMDGISITDERRKVFTFSIPYAQEPNGFITDKDSPLAKLPGDGKIYNLDKNEAEAIKIIDELKPYLKGKTLGVQTSTTHSRFIEKYMPNFANIKQYKTTPEHDLDLAAGRVDLIIADRSIFRASLETPALKNFKQTGPMFVGGIIGSGVGVAFAKGNDELKAKFDQAIKEAIADGSMKALSEKWFKVSNTPEL